MTPTTHCYRYKTQPEPSPTVSKTQGARATAVPFPEEQHQPVPAAENMTAWPPLQFEKKSTAQPARLCSKSALHSQGTPACLPAYPLNPLAPSSLHRHPHGTAGQPASQPQSHPRPPATTSHACQATQHHGCVSILVTNPLAILTSLHAISACAWVPCCPSVRLGHHAIGTCAWGVMLSAHPLADCA
jgi:hypothetical protein